ncbi:MAG: nuclear transport factor 2 family protein [Caulobacterales bacterium]
MRLTLLVLALAAQPIAARAAAPAPEIVAVLDAYRGAWNGHQFDRLAQDWDTADPMPVYLAEEAPATATDWPAVRAYWKDTDRAIERIQVQYANIGAKPVGPDQVMVVKDMRWDALWDGGRLTGDNRVVASLRRTKDGWKFFSWVEAPLAPIVYMRRLYQNSAPPETAKALRGEK